MSQQDPLIGRVIAKKYRILDTVGVGGMSHVYLAEHIYLKEHRAIKVLKEELVSDLKTRKRFLREVKISHQIHNLTDHIVKLHDDYGFENEVAFYVMEYLEGELLSERLKNSRGRLSIPWATRVVTEICEVMQIVHDAGIVHRDLKPDNIFLINYRGKQDFVKMVDFGLAKIQEADTMLTQQGMLAGTPSYMSPEQIQGPNEQQFLSGQSYLDGRSDIYAMGCILFELLTGRPPFDFGEHQKPKDMQSLTNLLMRHINEAPPSPRTLRKEIPLALEEIIFKALAKKPEDRFPNMKAFSEALLKVPYKNVTLEIQMDPKLLALSRTLAVAAPKRGPHVPEVEDRTEDTLVDKKHDEPPPPQSSLVPKIIMSGIGFLLGVIATYLILRVI